MILTIATVILAVALLLSLVKLLFPSSAADKVIVIDVAGFQLLGLSILLSLHDRSEHPLQFAFVLALLGFFSTLILSRIIRTD